MDRFFQNNMLFLLLLSGGLLEWDMWARIDRNRLPRRHKYASIGPQIRLYRVAIGPPPRHQQTTVTVGFSEHDPSRMTHICGLDEVCLIGRSNVALRAGQYLCNQLLHRAYRPHGFLRSE